MSDLLDDAYAQLQREADDSLVGVLSVGDHTASSWQMSNLRAVLLELNDTVAGQKLRVTLINKGKAEPEWWHSPLGRYTASSADLGNDSISQADAAKILNVTNGTVSQLVKRGTLLAANGKPLLSATLQRMLSKPASGRPRKQPSPKGDVSDHQPMAKPILKWAGGKTQMLNVLLPLVPKQYGTYIEPFFGGGALFFALQPKRSVLADSNPELINLYTQVRDHVEDVIQHLADYHNDKDEFLRVRAMEWQSMPPAQAAARMLYLNKTCFNGLYRVNRRGKFNTPFGNYKNPRICDPEALRNASQALSSSVIVCDDYRDVLTKYAKPGDFIFLDPPYIPVSQYADFKRYTKEQFDDDDHRELATEFTRLHDLGCHVMETNSNHPLVHELYEDYPIQIVPTKRYVSCKGSSRTGEDTIITAHPRQRFTDLPRIVAPLSQQVSVYPPTRFMGSKQKLLPELWDVASRFRFDTVADLFSGSGVVSYMFKAQGKQVISNDYMAMNAIYAKAMIENQSTLLSDTTARNLLKDCVTDDFVTLTFKDLYYSDEDNHLIDVLRTRIKNLSDPYENAIAMTALIRACIKKRPRGIFTYTGHRYDDGRKDLQKTLAEQFLEAVDAVNAAVFNNHRNNRAIRNDALRLDAGHPDLVYMDPPYYSPLSDNEYVRRYHFVEGLACDWQGVEMQPHTKTKKFKSYPTPFSSRTGAEHAFDELFGRYRDSILIVSYSSNSEPTKDEMLVLLRKYKRNVDVVPVSYRYSFGTQHRGNRNRNTVKEYFFVGW